ncbi:class I SAM-dependent methyltransferase [Rhodobacter lacus]|uniref:Class I SAM-dependent methyltransferase n=1 Tax=Rhodobacter lacus TaxID=1641972 RepID=A0ABW5A6E5_9RHOB
MGFFDFLQGLERYAEDGSGIARLNLRHDFLIAPLRDALAGARVLDLAAHDGRWSYAFAEAGACEVVGIEGRPHLVERFQQFPDGPAKDRVTLRVGDIFEGMEEALKRGERYDVVGVLGIFYHIMDHFRLMQLVTRFEPKLIVIDSEFALRPGQVIMLVREDPSKDLNALPQTEGQQKALIGIPSAAALEAMADVLGYDVTWADWEQVPRGKRGSVGDYFRAETKRRATAYLTPKLW